MISIVENRDCMDAMKEFPDKFFDLAIVDPPYGIGGNKNSTKHYKPTTWDNDIPRPEYFEELKRVSKNQIIWGENFFPNMGPGRIVWNKLGRDIGRREQAPTISDCELAYHSFGILIKMFSYTQIGNVEGNDYQIDWERSRIHPTQKPIALYKWLLKNYATCNHCHNSGTIYENVAGDGLGRMAVNCEACECAEHGPPKILDTHLGSGSSRIAAYDMGFDFYGYELDKDYFDASCKRFDQYKAQLNLFK